MVLVYDDICNSVCSRCQAVLEVLTWVNLLDPHKYPTRWVLSLSRDEERNVKVFSQPVAEPAFEHKLSGSRTLAFAATLYIFGALDFVSIAVLSWILL